MVHGNLALDDRDLRRANFRLIEKELYHYPVRVKQVAEWRSNIIHATHVPEVAVQTGPADSTYAKVAKLQSAVLAEIMRRLEAIEWACKVTQQHPEKGRWELVRRKYFEGRLTNEGIMQELHISRDTFYRWRREFVQLVADRLGWEI